MLFNMCVTFHHDLCCIFSNLVYFIHPGPPTALSSKHISWSHHLVWSVGWCHMFFFGLCGMWLCATNLHMTHMYCNGIHCHFCWLHVPHDMHDSHLPRQCWWAWWINHLFTSWVIKIHSSGLDMVRSSIDYLCQGCACVISAHVKNHLRLRHKCDLHCWQRRWLSLSVPLNQPSLLYWPGGCVSCNGWQSLWWDAGRLSASGLSAWSSAPQMEDSWLTLQEILCCVFVSGDFLKPYHIYKNQVST